MLLPPGWVNSGRGVVLTESVGVGTEVDVGAWCLVGGTGVLLPQGCSYPKVGFTAAGVWGLRLVLGRGAACVRVDEPRPRVGMAAALLRPSDPKLGFT